MNKSRRLAGLIRRLARKEMHGSKSLWKEYRRVRQARWRQGLNHLRFFLLVYLIGLFSFLLRDKPREFPLLMLTLYSTATVLVRATVLTDALYRSWDLAFFMHYPVADAEIFSFEWRKFLWSSLLVWFFAVCAFAYLAVQAGNTAHWAVAIAAGTLQWAVVVTLVVVLSVLGLAWPKTPIATACYLLALATPFISLQMVRLLNQGLVWLPTAWIPFIFDHGILQGSRNGWYLLVPTLALLACFAPAAKAFRRRYPLVELEYPLLAASETGQDEEALHTETEEMWFSAMDRHPETAIAHLPFLQWESAGWIERLAIRWLGERDRSVADFLCGGQLGLWSGQWRRGLKLAAIGIATLLIPGNIPPAVYFGLGIIATMIAFPVLGGYWEGMQLRRFSGNVSPAGAGLPLSYDEVSQVMIKVNLVRAAVWAPFFLLYAAALAWRTGFSPVTGLAVGLDILLLLLVFQPITILGQHSYGTNDSKRLNLHLTIAFLIMGLLGLLLVACVIIFLVALSWAPIGTRNLAAVAAVFGMVLVSFLLWFCYRFVYNRGRVDLMRANE